MNVTTINITTVGLSNTESEVCYESDINANRAPLAHDVTVSLVLSEPCGIVAPITRLSTRGLEPSVEASPSRA